ncbi:MAG: hypothetical protein ABW133_11085 [Polyangiaceae bacterium]
MHVPRTSEATLFAPPRAAPLGSELSSGGDPGSPASGSAKSTAGSTTQPFTALLKGLGTELDRGEDLAQKAIRGGGYGGNSPEKLIALQAGIYRYSEAIDLASKLVDRGTQAVRTTLQNQ